MTLMSLEVTELLDVQSSPAPMKDRVHRQNQLTVMVRYITDFIGKSWKNHRKIVNQPLK